MAELGELRWSDEGDTLSKSLPLVVWEPVVMLR